MDWGAAIGMDRGTLKRTIALLFALAGLSDRASLAPWPVRVLALAILRHGETVARELLVEAGHPGAQPGAAVTPAASSPADAVALAFSLRLLALALSDLLTPARDARPVCARSHGPAARLFAPADRHPTSKRHVSDAIRAPPCARVWSFPNRSVP